MAYGLCAYFIRRGYFPIVDAYQGVLASFLYVPIPPPLLNSILQGQYMYDARVGLLLRVFKGSNSHRLNVQNDQKGVGHGRHRRGGQARQFPCLCISLMTIPDSKRGHRIRRSALYLPPAAVAPRHEGPVLVGKTGADHRIGRPFWLREKYHNIDVREIL